MVKQARIEKRREKDPDIGIRRWESSSKIKEIQRSIKDEERIERWKIQGTRARYLKITRKIQSSIGNQNLSKGRGGI